MFSWLSTLIDDTRIAFDYFGYERAERKKWIEDAEKEFSTTDLETRLRGAVAALMDDAAMEFDTPIEQLKGRQEAEARVLSDATIKLEVLSRNYGAELDQAYAVRDHARCEMEACRTKLSSAYDDLNTAKKQLDSWYARAEGNWFGNGGKKLPAHSFLGQDLRDRDRYKSNRDQAAQEIGRLKRERDACANRIKTANATIHQVKAERQAMYQLKEQGFDRRLAKAAIESATHRLNECRAAISRLERERESFFTREEEVRGIKRLEEQIRQLNHACKARIEEFDSKPISEQRKAMHRAQWQTKSS